MQRAHYITSGWREEVLHPWSRQSTVSPTAVCLYFNQASLTAEKPNPELNGTKTLPVTNSYYVWAQMQQKLQEKGKKRLRWYFPLSHQLEVVCCLPRQWVTAAPHPRLSLARLDSNLHRERQRMGTWDEQASWWNVFSGSTAMVAGGNQSLTVTSDTESKLQVQAISSRCFLNTFPEKLAGFATLESSRKLGAEMIFNPGYLRAE